MSALAGLHVTAFLPQYRFHRSLSSIGNVLASMNYRQSFGHLFVRVVFFVILQDASSVLFYLVTAKQMSITVTYYKNETLRLVMTSFVYSIIIIM